MDDEKKQDQKIEENLNFSSLVLMLAAGAMQNMGLMPNPINQKIEKNLSLARQTIDLLDILREKTRGNLTETESKLLNELLSDLKLKIVKMERNSEK